MDVLITYKDTPRGNPDYLIKGVNEFAHNSGRGLLILRTEKQTYFINVDMIRHIELVEGEESPRPTL